MDGRPNQLFKLLTIRNKAYAAVHVQLQAGPHFFDGLFAGDFQNPLQQNNEPGGHAGHGRHVFVDGALRQLFYFLFPFVHQGNGKVGGANPVAPERGVLQDHGAQIAVLDFIVELVDLVAPANDQALACEQIAFGVRGIIQRQHIF
jgi:hypothetical protein